MRFDFSKLFGFPWRTRKRRPAQRTYRPWLECLEDLTLPSTGAVVTSSILYVNAADRGAAIQNGTQAHPYGSIQAAVNNAVSGDMIQVAAGTYQENVVITTPSLTIAGPNATINPNTTTRAAEAIVEPGLTSSYNTSSVFTVEANGVAIEGLTIQGSITSATLGASQSPGFRLSSGVVVYAAAGISNSTNVSTGGSAPSTTDIAGLVVQNDIIQDFTQVGVYGDTSDGAASTANTIADNRIRDIPENGQGGFNGAGVLIFDNFYANIAANVVSVARTGIQTGNDYLSAGSFAPSISNNVVQASVRGIYFDLQYQNASTFTISNNAISQYNSAVSPTYNVGLLIQSVQGSVSSTINGNNVSGFLYGVEFAGNNTTNTVTLQGGTLSSNTYGIWDTNNDYFNSAAYNTTAALGNVTITKSAKAGIWIDSTSANSTGKFNTTNTTSLAFTGGATIRGGGVGVLVAGSLSLATANTLNNTAFLGLTGNYITLAKGAYAGAALDATAASFDAGPKGTPVIGANVTRAEGFAIVNRVADAVSDPTLGLVRIKPQNIYVTTKTGSIQRGINAASAGDTVNVAGGLYIVNGNFADSAAGLVYEINIDKSVTLLGPNASYNPQVNTVLPSAPAILIPGMSDPNPSDSTAIAIIGVNASNVTIAGFTINGDNPGLANAPKTVKYNNVPIDAVDGIASDSNVGGITVSNNVVENFTYAGVDFENGGSSGNATANNSITENLIANLGGGGFGFGMGAMLDNNSYADVTNNVMKTVRVGVQTGNFSLADPNGSFVPAISNNSIAAVRRGIYYNLHSGSASPFVVASNTITAVADPTITQWDGIMIASQQNAVSAQFINNTINGSADTASTVAGYDVWNTPTTGSLVIQGGSVAGVDYGVWVNTYEGNGSNAGNTQVSVNGLAGTARQIGVYVEDSSQNTTGATATAALSDGPTVATGGNGVGIDISGTTAAATVLGSTITGNIVGIRVDNGGALSSATSNAITHNQVGVQVTSGAASLHANRIVGNGVGVSSVGNASNVNATNNWWGANGGPNTLGSDRTTTVNGGQLNVSTWLVLSVSASPDALSPGESATVTVDLTHNNLGAAVTPTIPSTPVLLVSSTGAVTPHSSTLINGTATAVFKAATSDSQVSATVDNQKAFAWADIYPVMTGIHIAGPSATDQTYFAISFSQPVTLSPGAITLEDQTNGDTPVVHLVTHNGGLTYIVTFSGSGITAGALDKGKWVLTVHAQDVYDADGLSPPTDSSATFNVA
jgi:hypothetical protein